MDVAVVRTKLQALQVMELIRKKVIKNPVTLIVLYQYGQTEDAEAVEDKYTELAANFKRRVNVVQVNGFYTGLVQLADVVLRLNPLGAAVYYASIDYHAMAIVLKFCPWVSVYTFDDGAANVINISHYYCERPGPSNSLLWRRFNVLFPKGPAHYIRGRSKRHFTIYPKLPNILPPDRVTTIHLNWCAWLDPLDKGRIDSLVSSSGAPLELLLGTVYHQHKYGEEALGHYKRLVDKVALYLPHPREKVEDSRSLALRSPAESIILYLSERRPLVVYHFGSSAALPFEGVPGIELVELVPVL